MPTEQRLFDLAEERKFIIRTDPHSHILPGIDDGSRDLEMSVRMARRAAANGFESMVATPHACHPAAKCEYNAESLRERVAELNYVLRQHGIPVTIYPGMEFLLNEKIPDLLESGQLITWADQGRYVLMEIGFHKCPDCLTDVLDYFDSQDLMPIIAHPERYTWLPGAMDVFDALNERGYFFQINVMSLNGGWGIGAQNLALEIISRTDRWLTGTDSHSDADKFWDIEGARRILRREGLWTPPPSSTLD